VLGPGFGANIYFRTCKCVIYVARYDGVGGGEGRSGLVLGQQLKHLLPSRLEPRWGLGILINVGYIEQPFGGEG